jgi:NADH dehydrogenase (ubiquinone) 1 beta subcomplex subunit 8
MFSPEEYTHTKPGKGLFQIGCFVAALLGLTGVVAMFYPDKPSAAREFEGGLERELGGPTAVRVGILPDRFMHLLTAVQARAPGDE